MKEDPEHVRKRNESITINMLVGSVTIPAYNAYVRKNEPGVWYDADTHEKLTHDQFEDRVKAFFETTTAMKYGAAARRFTSLPVKNGQT